MERHGLPVSRPVVPELFEDQVRRSPDTVAVVFGESSLTYAELNARANRLAHWLRELGVGPEVMVGLAVERGLDLIAGVLGILKAGGAYVPLDVEFPAQRLAFMLETPGQRVVVADRASAPKLPAVGGVELRVPGRRR